MGKLLMEEEQTVPRWRVLKGALVGGLNPLVVAGYDSDGKLYVASTVGGKATNSVLTNAIRYIKIGPENTKLDRE